MAMAMAAKIARSLLAVRSSSSIPISGLVRPSVASLSDSLGAVNLNRSTGSYSPINVRFYSAVVQFNFVDQCRCTLHAA
ncbi:hypothetical protein L2E82_13004 [Cichorium intybus]|uniref:Uncharacterized protein n=1 Tax=Cichorium intybus TaxID=13427 RepID=A0ACB9GIR6_CICIN|nr:hypothetical protein L2E82_13004 [Cichorium intybus]